MQVRNKFLLEKGTPHNSKAKLLQRSVLEVPFNPAYSVILGSVDGTLPSKSQSMWEIVKLTRKHTQNFGNQRLFSLFLDAVYSHQKITVRYERMST